MMCHIESGCNTAVLTFLPLLLLYESYIYISKFNHSLEVLIWNKNSLSIPYSLFLFISCCVWSGKVECVSSHRPFAAMSLSSRKLKERWIPSSSASWVTSTSYWRSIRKVRSIPNLLRTHWLTWLKLKELHVTRVFLCCSIIGVPAVLQFTIRLLEGESLNRLMN